MRVMPGRIPSVFIDQLLSRADIVEVINRRVPLKAKGREFAACCPFHDEKTPSFTVSPAKQFFHCFGCGESGSAIGFVMRYDNMGFVEAVESLAAELGLEVPREGAPDAVRSPPAPLYATLERANQWYQKQLRGADADAAVAYLKSRGLTGKIALEFGVGLAPDGWDNLTRALGRDAPSRRHLRTVGLVAERERDGGLYDRFRGRVMFPIEDHRGRVIGFGGRVLGDGEPKYLNSPETPLFKKGEALYRLHRARRAIGEAKRAIVVEGYMDALGLAQFGVGNAVATLGTATTHAHITRLFQLAPEIVFCFDGDRAGRAAAIKAMHTTLPEMRDGRQAGFLFLPEGEDPDSAVRAEGKDGFTARLRKAQPLPDFFFAALREQADMNRMDGRARLVGLAMPLIGRLPNGALRQLMLERLSSLSGLSVEQLPREAASRDARGDARRDTRSEPPRAQRGARALSPLAVATSVLLQHPHLAAQLRAADSVDSLQVRGVDTLRQLLAHIKANPNITTARLLELFRDDPNYLYLHNTLATHHHPPEVDALGAQVDDILARLLARQTEQQRREKVAALTEQIEELPDGDEKRARKRELQALLAARE